MTKKEINDYINKILNLKRSNIRKEISDLCNEIGNSKLITFLETGGVGFVLDKISSTLFYSGKKIDNDIRIKICIFNIVETEYCSIFYDNERIAEEKYDFYRFDCIKEKEIKVKVVKLKIEEFLKNMKRW